MPERWSISVPAAINNIYRSAVPAQKYLTERRSAAFRRHYTPAAAHLAFIREKIRSTECIVSWDRKRCRNNAKYVSGFLKIRRKSDWRPTAAVIPEFNMNRRIRNKSYGEAKIRDILRPVKTQAGTRDTEAEIRDVPGNTGRLASLYLRHYKSPTALFDMHHLTCGISSPLHSVNLIVFTLLLVHLILCISPHHSHHFLSHYLSLPRSFNPDLKLICFTNPFLHSHSAFFRTAFMDLKHALSGHWLFVCYSFFFLFIFCFWSRVTD